MDSHGCLTDSEEQDQLSQSKKFETLMQQAHAAEHAYSLSSTANQHAVDAFKYLREALQELKGLQELSAPKPLDTEGGTE